MVYLSCDRRRRRFIGTVEGVVSELNASLHSTVNLVYPSKGEGGDTGFVSENVLRLQDADVVIFDITPILTDGSPRFNMGVMIEYGIFLSMEKPLRGNPWGGKEPRPAHQVFLEQDVPLTGLTPILNEASIKNYQSTDDGLRTLAEDIRTLLSTQAARLIEFAGKVNSSIATSPQIYNYKFDATTS